MPVLSMLATALITMSAPLAPVQPEESAGMLRLFLDCSACDQDYVRTEIPFIEFVRDRTAGDVHLLVTTETTGGGGRVYTLHYLGAGGFEGRNDTLSYSAGREHTPDDVRRELTRVIKVGLMSYLTSSPLIARIDITLAEPSGEEAPAVASTEDPWDYWVFTVGGSGNGSGESQTSNFGFSGRLSASRTTEALKISLGANASYRESSFEVPDEPTIRSFRRTYSGSALVVRSLGPHVSGGFSASVSSSTFGNQRLGIRIGPAFEYDVFPYAESTRRMFTVVYTMGVAAFDYAERTIYGVTSETRGIHGLTVGYSTRQPWGSVSFSVDASQYLHDTSKYQASLFGSGSIRLLGGLSLSLSGSYSRIHDQLSLEAGSLTQQEILLRQRQLATNYRFFTSFGLTYRFGSVVNSIVNPRLRGGVGEAVVFF
jgi:hypothetical protein